MTEYFEPSTKKGRGMAQRSLDLIEAIRVIVEATQPITGRGVGYKLFTQNLMSSMARSEMSRVYRLLLIAREQGIIPWEFIVDETREFERVATWDDPEQYARCVAKSYRRDFWNQQPVRVRALAGRPNRSPSAIPKFKNSPRRMKPRPPVQARLKCPHLKLETRNELRNRLR